MILSNTSVGAKEKKDKKEEQIEILLSLTEEWRSDVNLTKENSVKQIAEATKKSKFYIERIREEEAKSKESAWKYVINTPNIPDDIILDFCRK